MKSTTFFVLLLITVILTSVFLVDAGPGDRGRNKSGRKRKNKEKAIQQQSQQLPQYQPQPDESYFESGSHSHSQQYPPSFALPDEAFMIDDPSELGKLPPPPPPPSGPLSSHTCEPIRIDTCKGIGYNVTSMPNFVGHELQIDAELQLQTFMPLISYGCSSQLKFFLCSVYVPMCTEKVPVMIGPCRPLCESVRSRCAPVLEELGFPWPEALNCSKFNPANTVDQMCMEGPPPDYIETPYGGSSSIYNSKPVPNNYPAPASPPVIQSTHTHSDLAVPVRPQAPLSPPPPALESPPPSLTSSTTKPKKCFHYRQTEAYAFLDLPGNHQQCIAKCSANILFSHENKQFVDYWTAVWSGLSILSCLFTLFTFSFSTSKSTTSSPSNSNFRYPERAIVYIAACYLIYSLAFLYRAIIGRATMSCHQEATTGARLLIAEAAYNPHCTLSFLMLYYFGMCGAAWFLVLAATWSASLAFRWSPDRLDDHRSLYHSFAWCTPALQTLAALVLRAVDADELTGTCFVGNQSRQHLLHFVLVPLSTYLGLGVLFFIAAFTFIHLVSVHDDDEHCPQCSSSASHAAASSCSGSTTSSTPVETGPLFMNGASSEVDVTDAGTESAQPGCGDFCRRIRGGSSNGSGSGQTLLLPPSSSQTNHFCTVSSTSSSYSGGPGCPSKIGGYPSLARSTSTRGSTRRGPNRLRQSGGGHRRRHFHLRRSSSSPSSSSMGFLQSVLNAEDTTDPSAPILIRSGIFAIFYLLPAACVTAAYIYEYLHRDSWLFRSITRTAVAESAESTSSSAVDVRIALLESEANRPNFDVFNMKLFMSLVIGINTGIWILTAKNPINSWRCLFWKCFMKKVIPIGAASSGGPGGSARGSHVLTTVQTVAPVSGSSQHHQYQASTFPVHPYPVAVASRHHPNRPLPQQPQQQFSSGPDQFFYLTDLTGGVQGPGAVTAASYPCPTPCNVSTATNSTMVSANSSHPQTTTFFGAGGNLVLENPMHRGGACGGGGSAAPWPDVGQHFAPVPYNRPGNETAV